MTERLAVFDIDGTLVTKRKMVLPSTLASIRQLQATGVHVAIATGRNYKLARAVIEETGIHDYVVCNGSAYYIADQLVAQSFLHQADVRTLNEYTRTIGTNFLAETTEELYLDNAPDKRIDAIIAGCNAASLARPGYALTNKIVQAIVVLSREQELAAPELPHLEFKRFGPAGVDVLPAHSSKAAGIDQLAATLGVHRANVVAFGDNQNDKEMLAHAGIGIAMGHASADVQATADWVTGDSESDGIERGLKHIGWL